MRATAGPTTDQPTDGRTVLIHPSQMLITDTTQLGLQKALSGAAARQEAIAMNLANANTPGYRRKDVNFEDTLKEAFKTGDRSLLEGPVSMIDDTRAAMRPDGSSTDMDTEAAAQAKNGLQYNLIAAVMKSRTAIIRSALGLG